MKNLFSLRINVYNGEIVSGKNGEAIMLMFNGSVTSNIFSGEVLPGAVDTQQTPKGGIKTLSARYILKGKDFKGNDCKIFIENEAVESNEIPQKTKPLIYTDSKALSYLEDLDIYGTIDNIDGQLYINFYIND